jgi:L-threonylcarbamoyladenylate synthase
VAEVLLVDPTSPEPALIARAAECLRAGGLVAFPTETVYGLGAHALDRRAVKCVFAVKERPADDPLIVHLASIDDAPPLVKELPLVARELAARFWPGPLTIVLPRSDRVPDEVTAGLETIAIRVPSHPVAHALLHRACVPVAAPSANRFSRPSPTRASHVVADLGDRIDIVLDAGPTTIGLESTVVDLSHQPARVLRPGAVGLPALRAVLPEVTLYSPVTSHLVGGMPSPGMLHRHYAPATPLTLFEGDRSDALQRLVRTAQLHLDRGESVAVLAFTEDVEQLCNLHVRVVELASESRVEDVAARLYASIRRCDELGVNVILARNITTEHPLSTAIQDRLRRAAQAPTLGRTEREEGE